MNEREWLRCNEPLLMLAYLGRPRGDRKLLLFGVACCRVHWNLLTQSASREAVEWAERFADGEVERDEAFERLEWQSEGAAFQCEASVERYEFDEWPEGRFASPRRPLQAPRDRRAADAVYLANALMTLDTQSPFDPTFSRYESVLGRDLIRDIFGNPFRPAAFSLSWRTAAALSLARQMYEGRDFGAMPFVGRRAARGRVQQRRSPRALPRHVAGARSRLLGR